MESIGSPTGILINDDHFYSQEKKIDYSVKTIPKNKFKSFELHIDSKRKKNRFQKGEISRKLFGQNLVTRTQTEFSQNTLVLYESFSSKLEMKQIKIKAHFSAYPLRSRVSIHLNCLNYGLNVRLNHSYKSI